MNPCPTCKDVPIVDAVYCSTCGGKGLLMPPIKPKVTKENYSKLVADGEVSISEYDATVRVKLTFHTGQEWGVIVSQHLLNNPHVVLQDEVIRWLNKSDLGPAAYDLLAGVPTKYEVPSYAGLKSWSQFWNKPKMAPQPPDGRKIVHDLRKLLPGLDTMLQCPGRRRATFGAVSGLGRGFGDDRCTYKNTLQSMIVHLNDSDHRWPREDLADWLESLDVDLTFPTDTDDLPEPPPIPKAPGDAYGTIGWGDAKVAQVVKDIYAKQIDSYLNDDLLKSIYAAHGDAPIKISVQKNPPAWSGSNFVLDEMWAEQFSSQSPLQLAEQGDLLKLLEEYAKPCQDISSAAAFKAYQQPLTEKVKLIQATFMDSLKDLDYVVTPLLVNDWHWKPYGETPAPPSPIAAKKAHDDQQAELLAKLNKPKRKKGGK